MATVKYYLRSKTKGSAIQIQLSISKDLKMRNSTGLQIDYSDWSDKTSLPKQNNPHNKNLSAELVDLKKFVLEEYNKDFTSGVLFDSHWLKNKISLFFERVDVKTSDDIVVNYMKNFNELRALAKTKKTTDHQYLMLEDKFLRFQNIQKKNYVFAEVDKRVMLEFKNWLISKDKLMESTANRTLKNLKTVLLDARANGKLLHPQVDKFTIESVTSIKVFLNFEELSKIKNANIIGEDLLHARDWLLIGCYTGQRVSDLLEMNPTKIFTKTDSEGESYRFIDLVQRKTGKDVSIPIHDEVEQILKKYGDHFPPLFRGATLNSNATRFNSLIKKVCEFSGINQILKGRIYDDNLKRNDIVETEKFNLVSTHICRRSFATNFYGDKRFTTPQVMAITGHKTETTFLQYIGKTSSDHALNTAKTFREIKEKGEKIS
ncbi:phage integrase SAM-like domain-containing protein [Chryseobacterium sp. SG20098]|uniref:phage integrase SAM-like domain-containing protein n=1 Tax=Chryseobacterium sp. SG20098 TaxID=3074145 RepID=UPI0028830E31|nr:phage integrase SAM-like domain-containing protein [Chryseobacterium sp. SG20098]WNI35953.1 phage integrase SAM-like domain-containing protein [Chryseobacterium sp. SG20098]